VEITVRHAPSFAVVRCGLGAGEVIRAESGAMVATSDGIAIEAKMQGGLMKSLKRSMLGGESLFVTSYTAPATGGWVDCAANLPGDAVVETVRPDRPLILSRGAWICSEAGVQLDTKFGGMKTFAGGEGAFLIHATGEGEVVLGCYGALDVLELAAGEKVVVDSGHMVAVEDTVQMSLRRVSTTMTSLKSGEGFVFEFTGPGRVMCQTRNPSALVAWLTSALPFSRT